MCALARGVEWGCGWWEALSTVKDPGFFFLVMLHPHSSGSLQGPCGMGRRWEVVRERFLWAVSRGGVHHIHPCSIGQFYIPNLTERSWEIQLAVCMRRREIWLLVNTSIICHDQHLMECWNCMIFMSLITCRPSKQTHTWFCFIVTKPSSVWHINRKSRCMPKEDSVAFLPTSAQKCINERHGWTRLMTTNANSVKPIQVCMTCFNLNF